jgi:hypothetical protein
MGHRVVQRRGSQDQPNRLARTESVGVSFDEGARDALNQNYYWLNPNKN